MSLHVQINAVQLAADPWDSTNTFVEFSCWDGEDSAQVAFCDRVNVAHACFLAEKAHSSSRDSDAYEQFVMYLYDTDITEVVIGKQFDSE